MDNVLYEYLWGKSDPYRHLSRHMIDAGACARMYLSSNAMAGMRAKLSDMLGCPSLDAVDFICYLTALHDIGKASPYFVRSSCERFCLIPEEIKRKYFPRLDRLKFRHERESACAVRRIWEAKGVFGRRARKTFSAVLELHHQGKHEDAGFFENSPAWNAVQDRLEAQMSALFCPFLPDVKIVHHDALGAYLVGLVVLCDWVASSHAFDDVPDTGDDKIYLAAAIEHAERTLRAYGLTGDASFPRVERFTDLWPAIPASAMRPVQIACADAALRSARLTIIEAPMGEGKTEAALYMAARLCDIMNLQGIYMALPTAATSNQMFDRFQDMLEKLGGGHSIRLLHALAWLLDESTPELSDFQLDTETDGDAQSAAHWLAPLRRGLLAENAVGTVDQAMAAVLYRQYGLLRLTGLAGKVLLIDEIHAYDAYMSEIIGRLLEWCDALRIPVILLSATLQRAQKEHYLGCYGIRANVSISDAYPLVTQVDGQGRLVETPVPGAFMKNRFLFRALAIMDDPQEIARRAVARVAGGGCLCVMLNTVHKAQAVYRAIKACGFGGAMLFHARFLTERRAKIEEDCVKMFGKDGGGKRPDTAILVCTQVVEQSLDVDFDGMMTELAPIDLLLQRAGRVHRHRSRTRPAGFGEPLVEVLVPGNPALPPNQRYEASGCVYDPYILACTEDLLATVYEIRVPEDVRACIEKVYGDLSIDRMEDYIRRMTGEDVKKVAAAAVLFPQPDAEEFFGAASGSRAKFERPDEGVGFHVVKGAKTRYDADSVGIAFLNEELFSIARQRRLSRREEMEIMKKTVSIRLTSGQKGAIMKALNAVDLKDTIYNIDHGHMKLCLAVRTECEIAKIGDLVLHVDDEFGVWTERDATCIRIR